MDNVDVLWISEGKNPILLLIKKEPVPISYVIITFEAIKDVLLKQNDFSRKVERLTLADSLPATFKWPFLVNRQLVENKKISN